MCHFEAHVELLQFFLAHRDAIVERIQGVLNAQRQPVQYLQDGPLLSRHFEDCFFTLSGVTHDQSRLRRQLDEAHWASGFKPRESPGLHNDLVDPAEMMKRGFCFVAADSLAGSRWSRSIRAHAVQLVCAAPACAVEHAPVGCRTGRRRRSAFASSGRARRAMENCTGRSTACLSEMRGGCSRWHRAPRPMSCGPISIVAERIAETLSAEDRIEIHKAGVRMAGGHLRSQLRHRSTQKGVPIDEHSLVLSTRNSNALDLAPADSRSRGAARGL